MPPAAEKVTITATDTRIPAFYFPPPPDRRRAGTGLLLFHGSDGLQAHHREMAARLAAGGYQVLLPEWFGSRLPRCPDWASVTAADLEACGAWLRQDAPEKAAAIGIIGVSRGGGVALYAASLIPGVRAVVNFSGLTGWEDGMAALAGLNFNPRDHLDFLRRVSAPILSFHGDADDIVPVSNTYQLDKACRRFGVAHRYFIYPGVGHSFIWPDSERFHPRASADAEEKTRAFLAAHLS